jgi:hypothetical protein
MKPEHYQPRFTINLSGIGIFGIAIYGVAEFLRGKRILRGVVGVLGIIVILAHPLASTGIRLPLVGVQWMFGILLVYLSAISGKDFYLHFGYLEDQKELEDTEKRLDNTSDPEDFIGLDKARLAEYYSINQAQAKASYRLVVVGIISGMVLVLCSLWAFTRDPMGDRPVRGMVVSRGRHCREYSFWLVLSTAFKDPRCGPQISRPANAVAASSAGHEACKRTTRRPG